jgi:hypothetical protein
VSAKDEYCKGEEPRRTSFHLLLTIRKR